MVLFEPDMCAVRHGLDRTCAGEPSGHGGLSDEAATLAGGLA